MEVNVRDYISESEMKSIVVEEFRASVRKHLSVEKQFERILSNVGHHTVYKVIDEELNNNKSSIDAIKDQVHKILDNGISEYSIFRVRSAWGDPESLGQTLLNEAVAANKQLVNYKVVEAIEKYDYGMITKDEVADALNEVIYNKMFGNE